MRRAAPMLLALSLALFAYIGAAFCAKPDWPAVLKGTFLPTIRLDGMFVETLLAICGTTISPYLFFWQASQEVEEKSLIAKRHRGKATADQESLANAAWDVNLGMLFSNVVMYFIILATAATLHESGQTDIQTATEAAA